MTTTFPTPAAGWTSEFVQTLFAEAGNTFNTNRMSGSLSRWPAFGVTAPNLIHMPRLLDESTTFLLAFCQRPDLVRGRIFAHVGYSNTWGHDVPKSFTVVITNSRASASDYSDIETEELVVGALSGLPSLAGKCANLVECFGAGVEDVPCQAPSTIYVTMSTMPTPLAPMPAPLAPMPTPLVPMRTPLAPMPAPLAPMPAPLAPMPTPLAPMRTPLAPMPTPLAPMPTPLAPMPTPLSPMRTPLAQPSPTGRAVNSGPCKHCYQYHGRWHKAWEASKEEKRNGKKRRRSD